MKQNIFLIGPTGSGKTTIGRMLAEQLGLRFMDADQELVERTGVSIPTIFEYEGEEGFRVRETALIDDVTQEQGIVLATGGGAVLNTVNRDVLTARGVVVYLQVSLEEQLRRTKGDKNRPLLQDNIEATLKKMAEERTSLYEAVADYTFITDNSSAKRLATNIVEAIEKIN